ncbi:hypothetical protein EVAR_38188_1 [Eumeta japonica]|uniref:Uncharacterized protein n=1 Tax=Eumeta variegata TaxID=151549 RepID=A0A4C1WEY7_EUMVA|nr:hypothetical protein EVAR_38188_1 [Eumeta japonica]
MSALETVHPLALPTSTLCDTAAGAEDFTSDTFELHTLLCRLKTFRNRSPTIAPVPKRNKRSGKSGRLGRSTGERRQYPEWRFVIPILQMARDLYGTSLIIRGWPINYLSVRGFYFGIYNGTFATRGGPAGARPTLSPATTPIDVAGTVNEDRWKN